MGMILERSSKLPKTAGRAAMRRKRTRRRRKVAARKRRNGQIRNWRT
jgi:hypothetical protein